jgi:hypothetical protein
MDSGANSCGAAAYAVGSAQEAVFRCLERPRATYSLAPKVSIDVAACSANFKTLPE